MALTEPSVRADSATREWLTQRGWGAFAVLTEEGFAVLKAAAPGHVEGVRTHLFDQLTDEQVGQLRAISQTLYEHLAAIE